MIKLFFVTLLLLHLHSKGQDPYFRVGVPPGYGKTDTFKARLLVQAGPYWDKRKVEGYVILRETPKGCRTVGFLTKSKKSFPRKFELINHELISHFKSEIMK